MIRWVDPFVRRVASLFVLRPADHPDGEPLPSLGTDDPLLHLMRGDHGRVRRSGSAADDGLRLPGQRVVVGIAACGARVCRPYLAGTFTAAMPDHDMLLRARCGRCWASISDKK
jgi:hypothetical protein